MYELGSDYVSDKNGYFWQKANGLEPCQVADHNKCKTCDYSCATYLQLPKLIHHAEIPLNYKGDIKLQATTQNEIDLYTILQKYNNNIENHVSRGEGLFLYSNTKGNGKTSWAIKIMRNYLENIAGKIDIFKGKCRAVYVNVPSFMSKTKANISDYDEELTYLRAKIHGADLVIWDDIGRENPSDYSREVLYSFINHLYEQGRAQIFTSNFSREELSSADKLGEQVTDRIQEMCMPLQFTGEGKRGDIAWYHTK